MQEHMQRYVNYLQAEKGVSPYTLRNYVSDLNNFFEFLATQEVNSLDGVDRALLRNYLAVLQRDGIVRASLARKLSALRSFFRFLEREKIVDTNPLHAVATPKLEKRLPSYLTLSDIGKLLQAPDTNTPLGQRDRAILELLYSCGLRVSELVNLNIDSINQSTQEIRVWGKGSKERIVLIGRPANESLTVYLKDGRVKLLGNRSTDAIFVNRKGGRLSERAIQLTIGRYARKAGLDKRVFPHLMRHTFATHMLDGGADLRSVQELLGHASLSTTQVYTHISKSQARKGYLAAHPRAGKG